MTGTTTPEADEPLRALPLDPPAGQAVGWRKRAVKARLFEEPGAPARVGRFIVLDALGSGGMGSVLRAYDETLDRQVAVKLMHPGVHEQHGRRMLREAQALAKLSHPNVVQVYEVGEVDGQLFIAMELVAGQTLEQWQATRRPWRSCLEAYVQAGRGLAAAHAAGMVHRDFKPSNCIVDPSGRVRVLDFGLARSESAVDDEPRPGPRPGDDEPVRASSPGSSSALEERLTTPGSVLGTVAYMAPEQLQGRELDARADQYSFCLSLVEALLGRIPRRSTRPTAGATGSSPRLPATTREGVPRWLLRALERGLAHEPAARWPSMDALLVRLERGRRRRSLAWMSTGAALTGLVVVGQWLDRAQAPPEPRAPCLEAAGRVAAAWGDQERVRVRGALLSTAVAFGPQAWASVRSQLDGYAGSLESAYVDACEATMVRHEQTRDDLQLRQGCLDERLAALRQTLAVLGEADAGVVENAVTMVAALPDVEPCRQLEALRRGARSEEEAAADEPLRDQLQQARALAAAGKPLEGLAVVGPLVASTSTRPTPALLAEARLVEGELLADLGRHEPAARSLRIALQGALAQQLDAVAIEALCELVYLVGVEQARGDAGAWLGAMAEALADRERASTLEQARVLTAVGQLASARGDHALARTHLERAVELLRARVGDDHIALAEPLDSLGVALRNQHELAAAREQGQRALDIRIRWQGPEHPSSVHQRINLGVVLDAEGRAEQAQEQYHTALAILEARPAEHLEIQAHAHTSLGFSLASLERWDQAARELARAVDAWVAAHGPDHPRVAQARLSLAGVLRADQRTEEAVVEYERALTVLQAVEHTATRAATERAVLDGLARSLERLGRHDQASRRRAELERLAGAGR